MQKQEEKKALSDILRAVMKVSHGRHGGMEWAAVIIYGHENILGL